MDREHETNLQDRLAREIQDLTQEIAGAEGELAVTLRELTNAEEEKSKLEQELKGGQASRYLTDRYGRVRKNIETVQREKEKFEKDLAGLRDELLRVQRYRDETEEVGGIIGRT